MPTRFDDEFDYVIVGAGSAGCVLANRLTEDPRATVLLIEAGGGDSSLYIQMPTALSIPMNMERFNWFYYSEPEPKLDGRSIHCPRGKILGGSSAINGMVYVRGNALDYDRWVELGATGWSYKEVLPYFKKAEARQEGGNAYRGDSGPLGTVAGACRNPLYNAFVEAASQAGYPRTQDMNGFQQEGFGRMDMTVQGGRRCSAARAYIDPIRKRPNLRIELGALANRLIAEGNRIRGLRYERAGTVRSVAARREVILSTGPIGTPHLLLLSGIGPGQQLQTHGISAIADLPAVGENLMDHLEFYFQQECRLPITLYSSIRPWSKALIGARWLLTKDGLGATNHFESGGFIRSRVGVRWPNIQYQFLPLAISYDGRSLADRHGFQVHVGPMRSKSRGHVRLRSPDPNVKPSIAFNYMSQDEDWLEMRDCVRLTREIFAQPALDAYRGIELQPGPDVQTDAEIDAFITRKAESAFHPCGTCRMGTDRQSVVDPQCRVHSMEGLRVVDSSIMPQIVTGNLNAPTIMIAEKAADMIKGVAPLAASDAPYFVAKDWSSRQRSGSL